MGFDDRKWYQRWWDRAGRRWLNPWGESARLRAAGWRLREDLGRERRRVKSALTKLSDLRSELRRHMLPKEG